MTLAEIFTTGAAIMASLGVSGVTIFALSSWLGRVWASRILEGDRAKYAREIEDIRQTYASRLAEFTSTLEAKNRSLQAELDKRVYVHRVEFETEFEVLRSIWKSIARVRSAFASLRPTLALTDSRESKPERYERLFDEYQDALNDLLIAADHNSPFYTTDVSSQVDRLITIAQKEKLEFAFHGDPDSSDWFKEGKENRDAFLQQANTVSESIRRRIASLSVLQ